MASPSSAARSSDRSTAPANAAMPMLKLAKTMHAEDQQPIMTKREHLVPVERLRGLDRISTRSRAHQQLPAAEQTDSPPNPTIACASKL